ncbi:MAG: PilZ domain-containing protein [Rhizobiales bacterium]|nr:PilZ domain-containing protein [Hyphomicrobiales bacterium]
MGWDNRKNARVNFEDGVTVQMMAIDGTWRRDCIMKDASDSGARLIVSDSLEGLELKEFFVLLSSTGLVYRRCRLVRLQGDEIGVEFLKTVAAKPKGRGAGRLSGKA